MGEIIPFRRPEKISVNMLWGEGMFGFNPKLLQHIFVAGDMVCLMFHREEGNEVPKGWELSVRCASEAEANAAYEDLIAILEEQYGIVFGEEEK